MPDITDILNAARIPISFHNKRLESYGAAGNTMLGYFTETYSNDRHLRVNVTVTGDPETLSRIFPMFARSAALHRESVMLLDLMALHDVVQATDTNDYIDRVYACELLCVRNMYSHGEPFPFTPIERARIESFLMKRSERGQRNCYDSDREIMAAEWWSLRFRSNQSENMRTLHV